MGTAAFVKPGNTGRRYTFQFDALHSSASRLRQRLWFEHKAPIH
jgi:hypothetical protein